MKILQVNNVFRDGSTGKIVADIHDGLLCREIDSIVCYGRGELYKEPNVYRICSDLYSHANHLLANLEGIMYGECFFSTNKLIRIIKKEKPDVVHLQCINGYFVNIYRLITWLKQHHILTVVTLHAEFMYTGGCGHSFTCIQWSTHNGCGFFQKCPRWKQETHSLFRDRTHAMWERMKNAFNGFDDGLVITSVSPWLYERAIKSPIFAGKNQCVILNGVDIGGIFHPYGESTLSQLKKEIGLSNEKVIFHATPEFNSDPNHIKGGYYLIELAKQMPNVKFIVAGTHADDLKVPTNMILLGKVSNQRRLASLYSLANLTVLTSRIETFSMVTAETLCCGTPIVGFEAGAPEMIALCAYSEFVKFGDINALKNAVLRMLVRDIKTKEIAREAKRHYSKTRMTNDYIRIYKKLIDERNLELKG